MRLRQLLLLLPMATASIARAATPGILGDWKTPSDAIVRLEPCDAAVCLRLVQLAADAPVTSDRNNPKTSLRSRKLCGLTIGTGFHQDGPERLSGGQLYDPKSGHTYHGTVTLHGDKLELRGYIGIALFGRSETWQRSHAAPVCR